MDDKVAMPADGGSGSKGRADGVNGADERGRASGGESGGSGYLEGGPKTEDTGGFMGHGGQTEIAYHGGGQAGSGGQSRVSTTTGAAGESLQEDTSGPKPGPTAPYQDRVAEQTREEDLGGRTVEVFEESGIAAAEATGNTGVEGQRLHRGDEPGSG